MYSVITLSMVKLVPGVILPSKILSKSIVVTLELMPPNVVLIGHSGLELCSCVVVLIRRSGAVSGT